MSAHQLSLSLPPPATDDVLRDRLAAAVESANATTDPAERVEHYRRIQSLRTSLGMGKERVS
jgi:hypothetical protein